MNDKLLADKINDIIKKSNEYYLKLVTGLYNTKNFGEEIVNDFNDFLLSNDDIYDYKNFKNLFIDVLISFDNSRIMNFLKNIITNHPDRKRTYTHILNDVKQHLVKEYKVNENYITKSRNELDKECDKLLVEGKLHELSNLRNYIKRKFRVHNYNNFVLELKDMAISVLKENDLDEGDRDYIRIREMVKKNPGYLGPLVWLNKNENTNINALKNLYQMLTENDGINKYMTFPTLAEYVKLKLPYTHTDGRTYHKVREFISDDINAAISTHKAKLEADRYPNHLRKGLFKNADFVEMVKLLNGNDYESVQLRDMYNKFFIIKVSKYKNQKELLDALNDFIYASKDTEDIAEKMDNIYDIKTFFNNGEIILARVLSQEAMEEISGDTSWCIAASIHYWVDYVGNGGNENIQIVLIDLTKNYTSIERKISFTLSHDDWNEKWKYVTGHKKNDNYIEQNSVEEILKEHFIDLNYVYKNSKDLGENESYSTGEYNDTRYF